MADITRWEPFGELMSLREAMDRLFEESLVRPRHSSPRESPWICTKRTTTWWSRPLSQA